ncbi:MAG TPA: sulfatase-like hydrolase/transferase [Clostridiales bacterium]|nr:sulfatase-like hydrolase/transferase [Clostridiales bacterium]
MNNKMDKPDILFIMTDHQRRDSIGMVQDNGEVSPNLNRLAEQSAVFTRAYNTCPLCVPARTALATGKYPTKNGVVFNDVKGLRAGNHKTIHQYLEEAGYTVGHVGVNHIQVKPSLKDRMHFDMWIDDNDYAEYVKELDINIRRTEYFEKQVMEFQDDKYVEKKYSNAMTSIWPHPEKYFKDNYFSGKAIEFIQKEHENPFALFVYFWAPHPPLTVPEPYASMFNPDNLQLPGNIGIAAKGEPANRRRGIAAQLAEGLTLEQWRKVWAAHLGLLNLVDAAIGRIFQELEKNGKMDSTLIVFTSDHGDHLGQHNMYQKMEMYEQAINVPFIVKSPNFLTERTGINRHIIDTPVSHLDILPTILDMTGLSIPCDLDGISLADPITRGVAPEERNLFCQYSGNPTVGDIRRAVISRRYKYVYDLRDSAELYDLEKDPLEMDNLAGKASYAEIISKMHYLCMDWGRSHNDWISFS